MKKLFFFAVVAGMIALVSCGPKKEDDNKAKEDSLAAVAAAEKMKADSLAAVAAEAEALRIADSIANAEALKNAKSSTPKAPKTEPDPKPKVVAGQGKG